MTRAGQGTGLICCVQRSCGTPTSKMKPDECPVQVTLFISTICESLPMANICLVFES